jgi:hypothetical protein
VGEERSNFTVRLWHSRLDSALAGASTAREKVRESAGGQGWHAGEFSVARDGKIVGGSSVA